MAILRRIHFCNDESEIRFKYQLVQALDGKIGPDLRRLVRSYLDPDIGIQRASFRALIDSMCVLRSTEDALVFHGIPIPWEFVKANVSRLFYVHCSDPSRVCVDCRGGRPLIHLKPRNVRLVMYPYIDFNAMNAIYGVECDEEGEVVDNVYDPHGGWLGVGLLELVCDRHTEVMDCDDPQWGTTLAECDCFPACLRSLLEDCHHPHTILLEPDLAARIPALIEAGADD